MTTSIPQIPNAIAQPNFLLGGAPTVEHLEHALAEGYKAFIDLRSHGEPGVDLSRETLTHPEIFYLHIPVAGAAGLIKENVDAFDTALSEHSGPFVVFCGSGNRVGALIALRAHWLQGKSAHEALEIGRSSGLTTLEPVVAKLLDL